MKISLKKLLCVAMAIICSIAMVSFIGGAVSSNNITAESVTVKPGDTVEIPISISNNTGFMGISLVFEYDKNILTPISVSMGSIVSSGLFDDSIGTSSDNKFKVVWCGSDEITSNGEICVLKFKVSDSASGDYKIKVSYEKNNSYDSEYKDVKFSCDDISINIQSNETPSKQTFWQKIAKPFVKVWNWIKGLFTK